MILDERDLRILRLAGMYRWLPYDALSRLGYIGKSGEMRLLMKLGLLRLSSKNRFIMLTPQGYDTLARAGYCYDPGSKRASAGSVALRRRLDVSSVMLTALRAGIDTLTDSIDSLSMQPSFFPAFSLRTGEGNMMNAASCVGFGHWGDKGYMLQYIDSHSSGMYLTNELRHFHNLTSVLDSKLDTPLAMIFAGKGYADIHGQISSGEVSTRHGKQGFRDFSDVYRNADLPIHLISCDETGAMQLALMRQPGYNVKIAKAAYGDRWVQRDDQITESDGVIDGGRPLIIAADMDVRRAVRVVEDAKKVGRKGVALVAFKEQLEGLIMGLFPRDGFVAYAQIKQPVLDAAFGKGFSLHSFDDGTGGSERYG